MAKLRMKKFIGWIAILSLLLMSVPVMPGSQAASLTVVKDTISDSDLGVVANHTITFTLSKYIPVSGKIVLDFNDSFSVAGMLDYTDIDMASSTGEYTLAATAGTGAGSALGVATSTGEVITITFNDTDEIATSTVITIEIGTHATTAETGDKQITNPPSAASYDINIATQNASSVQIETADARVAIIDDVVVTATVSATLTFTVSAVGSKETNQGVNGAWNDATSTATTLAFGTLTVNSSSTMAQDLAVTTNASDGFTVNIFQDQNLTSAGSDDIDCFQDSSCVAYTSASAWAAPAGTLDTEGTYGHFGITSQDATLGTTCANDYYGNDLWAGLTGTTQAEVMCHTGAADGSTADKGATRVGFNIEISALQEAGDYTNTLTYIATPTY